MRHTLPPLRSCIVLFAIALWAISAVQARTISFVDTNGVLSGASSFAGDFVFCSSQPCQVLETYNPSLESVTSGIVPTLYIGNSGFVLDKLVTSISVPGFVSYELTSMAGVSCTSVGGCQFAASDALQTVETIQFSVETPTTVTFRAVITPEPHTALLILFACASSILLRRKRA